MSESKPNQSPPEETTILHLNKFAAGQPAPASEESATIFIKKAAAETVQDGGRRVVVPAAAGALAPEDMLGAVAYCYAKGEFSNKSLLRASKARNKCSTLRPPFCKTFG